MSANKIYNHVCPKCNEETPHLPVHPRPLRIMIRAWKIIVFVISMGMVYPHVLSLDGDEFTAECTNCHTRGTISYG
jgi:hypothetical protein